MPALSAPFLALYVLVMLGSFAVRSAAGFGAGLIAVPMLALILPVQTAVSVTTVLTTLTAVGQVRRDWKRIAWRQCVLVFAYSMIGIGLGFYFIKMLDEDTLRRGLGIFLVLYAVHAVFSPESSRVVPPRWRGTLGAGAGIIGGFCSALFGAGAGPIYVVYFNILRLQKETFRATMSGIVVLGGVARIAGYGSFGFYEASSAILLGLGVPLAFIGSWLGDRLALRLSPLAFSRFVAALVFFSGALLLLY